MCRGSSYLSAEVSRSNMIIFLGLLSKGHMKEIQGERHAGVYMAKAKDLNVVSCYFLLVYTGISFLEPWVLILLQNIICTQSISV